MVASFKSKDYASFDALAEEFAERFRRGDRPSLEEYVARLPQMAAEVREMFPAMIEVERAEGEAHRDGFSGPASAIPLLRQVGDYRILREVGRGGMGVVYEAEQVSLGRHVALKVLPARVIQDHQALERFRREAKAAARLHHTNIVPVFEVGQDGDVAFYAMQFIQGQGLDLVIDELKRLRGDDLLASPPSRKGFVRRPATESGAGTSRFTSSGATTVSVSRVAQAVLNGQFASLDPCKTATDPDPQDSGTVTIDDRPGSFQRMGVCSSSDARASEVDESLSNSAVLPGGTPVWAVETTGRRQPYFRSVADLGRQAAQGLAYAHARGIIHRDIKPSNLLLDTAGSSGSPISAWPRPTTTGSRRLAMSWAPSGTWRPSDFTERPTHVPTFMPSA